MIQQLDNAVVDFFQGMQHIPAIDWIIKIITYLGENGILWILIAVIFLIFKKTRKCGIIILGSLVLGLIIGNLALKNIIARPRPFIADPSITLLISAPDGFSFPSGHTLSSFAAATSIFAWDKRYGIIALVMAALIGFSRIYLCVHYLTDVICGAILGVLIGLFAAWLYSVIEKKLTIKENRP